jgi:hypothetical protein
LKKKLNYYFFFDGPDLSSSRLVTSFEEPVSFDTSEEHVSSLSSTVLAGCVFAFAFATESATLH